MFQRPRTALAVLSAFGVIGALLPASAFAQSAPLQPAAPAAPAPAAPNAAAATPATEATTDTSEKKPRNVAAADYSTSTGAAAGSASSSAPPAAPPSSADRYETKWVPWNTGGPEAGLGFGAFAHLGVGHRFNRSPVPDAGPNSNATTNGLLIGIDAIVRFNRYIGVGIGYEHADLGMDQLDIDNTSFSDIRRGLNNLWLQARVYPLRVDPFAMYIAFGGGPSWQNVDTSVTKVDINSSSAGTKCGAHATAGMGLRGGVGGELSLVSGLTFFGEVGPDGYLLSEKDLGGCGPGAGNAINIAFRGGFAFGMEKTRKKIEPGDADKDGITDDKDACPNEPGAPNPDPTKNGCPVVTPKDKDADGIPDEVDACPEVPGVAQPDPAKNGCPLPKDRDNDGITDDLDACPDTAGMKTEDPKTNGCPDKDGDKIPDPVDACPDVPGVATSDPKTNGCPGDTDGDGINDDKDACPKEPGKADPDPEKNGCPQVVVRDGEIVINEQVQFDTGKATIKPVSDPLLDNVSKAIKDHPEILKIEVQGHTDNKGAKGLNTSLSNDRAKSVMKALVKRGVEDKRLSAHGYGPDMPIASNDTEEGRAKNRRVQFKILEKKNPDGSVQQVQPTTTPPAPKSAPAPVKPTSAPAKPADKPAAPPAKPAPAKAAPAPAKPAPKK